MHCGNPFDSIGKDMGKILENHRRVWCEKKILRVIYSEWYNLILDNLKPSEKPVLELGAGSGNFKEFMPDCISSDIDFSEWIDICFDAHIPPFSEDSISNIVMIDVLHHLSNPVIFFENALKVLEPGGKIVIIEPYPSPFSLIVYRLFHPEPFHFNVDYFNRHGIQAKDPWDSNQAIAKLLFFKHKNKFIECFACKAKIVKIKRFSYLLYPASGGFENKSMIPDFMIPVFKILEILLTPFKLLLAFRTFIVIEKTHHSK